MKQRIRIRAAQGPRGVARSQADGRAGSKDEQPFVALPVKHGHPRRLHHAVSATTPAYQALGLFRQSHQHHALVVDEFGSVLGLLTLFDLLGTLVADPDSAAIVRRDDGSYLLDAQLSFTEFADYFHLADAERQALTVYYTLGGFVLQQLGAVPRVGQHFT